MPSLKLLVLDLINPCCFFDAHLYALSQGLAIQQGTQTDADIFFHQRKQ